MPEFTGQIENGARVRVRFTTTRVGSIPMTGMGLIDTGATYTHVDQETAEIHRFRRLDTVTVNTASQRGAEVPTYAMVVEILDLPGHREQLRVRGFTGPAPRPGQPPTERLIALVGCDILNRGRFTYDGAAGTFTLDLP